MKKAFVIGDPIGHSKSPLIHGTWLAEHGIDGCYEAIAVAPDDLPAFMARVRSGEFAGGNVTIPHKEAVMALVDEVAPLAQKIGAVNTIVVRDGRLYGSNTDYLGFLANLDAGAPGWSASRRPAIVLGAGGASRAVLAGLIDRGIAEIFVLNRTRARAEALADEFGSAVIAGTLSEFNAIAPQAGLVVNTSSVGMDGSRFSGMELENLARDAVVTDIVYTPLVTPLLEEARAKGFATVDGLGMLLHQATPGFAAWFGIEPKVTEELRRKVLGR